MPTARELGLIPGTGTPGPQNSIVDVRGVMVGHKTIIRGDIRTGVTAILPHGGNLFTDKVLSAVEVINGFGKSTGLMQVQELGTLESPILLTNTFGVGTCANALIRYAIAKNPGIGRTTSTVNPVVCECNDGKLSDIQAMAVTEADALEALDKACDHDVEQGSIGAGAGMRCFGFKGGIGTASRIIKAGDQKYTLGILVLSNFGGRNDLILPNGKQLASTAAEPDKGSIIMIVATDAPLDTLQIRRVIRRCGAGLGRLGSSWGNGSGDVALGFSTAVTISHQASSPTIALHRLHDDYIDSFFKATVEVTVEAVLNSMTMSPSTKGREGYVAPSLADALAK